MNAPTNTKSEVTSVEPPAPPPEYFVAAKPAALWTLAWVVPVFVYAALPNSGRTYAYSTYVGVSRIALLTLVVLATVGIFRAWKFIGGSKSAPTWYTDGFLVALLIFWAIAPPTWFFLEYYMFDSDLIAPPEKLGKEGILKQVKTYADLASKVWAAVGASLGAAVAAARK